MTNKRWLILLILVSAKSHADILPYAVRTRPYSGFETGVRGDTRTVGMSGATLGLGDTFIAATDNPGAMAMTMGLGDDNITHTHIFDGHVQAPAVPLDTTNAGLALNYYPWAFSFGYLSPYREQNTYDLAAAPGHPALLNTAVQELRFTGSRVSLNNLFSLGLSINVAQAETAIGFSNQTFTSLSNHTYDLGFTAGASYQLPYRLLLGAAITSGMNFSAAADINPAATIPGLFQPIMTPWRGGLGLGWIPNRFFRADFSTFLIGTTTGAALLSNDAILVGRDVTVQPRIGAAYVFCDFKNLSGTVFFGSYYEVSRIDNTPSRFHKTIGTEVKPWIFTVGVGTDLAADYKDSFFSFSIDVFKVLEQLSLIPVNKPPHDGFLPSPFFQSDLGLSRPLVRNWVPDPHAIDPVKTGLAIPEKIEEGLGFSPKPINKPLDETVQKKPNDLPNTLKKEGNQMKKAQKRRLKKTETPKKTTEERDEKLEKPGTP